MKYTFSNENYRFLIILKRGPYSSHMHTRWDGMVMICVNKIFLCYKNLDVKRKLVGNK